MDLLMVALFVIQTVLLCWIASEVAKLRPEVLLSAQAKVQAHAKAHAAQQEALSQRAGSKLQHSPVRNPTRNGQKTAAPKPRWRWLRCLGQRPA